jgi:uncharacterized iron-regulated membrane protein
MYRQARQWHKWVGVAFCLVFIIIASSGFVLATTDRWEWVKPKTAKGEGSLETSSLTLGDAARSALKAGIPGLSKMEDIGRMEVHTEKNVIKVHSKDGYHEVQICGATGKILGKGRRWDQMAEHVHDLRIFHISLRDFVLPLAAIALFLLALSGAGMSMVPPFRRWKHRKTIGDASKAKKETAARD